MLLLPLEPRVAAEYLVGALRLLGGKGSGNFGHSGRPGEVGGSGTEFFHGTPITNVESIRKGGLKASKSGKNYSTAAGGSQSGHVYVASTEKEARRWAREVSYQYRDYHTGGYVHPAVVRIVIPKSELSRLARDSHFPTGESWQFKGDIKASWVKDVHVNDSEDISAWRQLVSSEVDQEQEVFVPILLNVDVKTLGGQGSGNFGHSGRSGERGGSAEGTGGGEKTRNARSLRALKAFIPITAANQRHAEKNELSVRSMIGGTRTDDNLPVDVVTTIKGRMHGVEVKTFINNTNDKITMRKAAIEKKVAWGRSNHASVHTVVIDDRDKFGSKHYSGHRIYYAKGSGSFRLNSLTKVTSPRHLKELLSK